jgi:hypothetical protein
MANRTNNPTVRHFHRRDVVVSAKVWNQSLSGCEGETKMTIGSLQGMRVAILVTDGFEQAELLEPRIALDHAGAATSSSPPQKAKSKDGITRIGELSAPAHRCCNVISGKARAPRSVRLAR